MPKRYVPKTYNNRRLLRIILGTVVSLALATVILFLLLFFMFGQYFEEGVEIPWLPAYSAVLILKTH